VTFNSYEFVAFTGLVVFLYHAAPPRRRLALLLIASYAYYVLAAGAYALVLLATTLLVFAVTRKMHTEDPLRRTRLAVLAIAVVLAALVFFKYTPALVAPFDAPWLDRWGRIAIPLGISYYTFKLISHVVDINRGLAAPMPFASLATYAAFFPQVPSGPIHRARDFVPQIERISGASMSLVRSGVLLAAIGFVKKVVFADRIALAIDPIFADPGAQAPLTVLFASYLFAMQLYLDFSGLTDIAVGIGRTLQIRAPGNFADPFFAPSVQEFWSRWHITLTGWLRDYVFMPLTLALRDWGRFGLAVALSTNMLLIALWHDATLPFVAFGTLHAGYLVCGVLSRDLRRRLFAGAPRIASIRSVLAPVVTFHLVVIAFVFFRCETIAQAFRVLRRVGEIPAAAGAPPAVIIGVMLMGAVATVAAHVFDRRSPALEMAGWWYASCLVLLLVVLYVFAPTESVSFVYVGF